MKFGDVGEFGLISRMHRIVQDSSERVILGIGDDAAVIRTHPGYDTLLTSDALIEGVHFDLDYTPFESLGWKALAINLSDIAAMGGLPLCATVSIAIPENWSVENVEKLYLGLAQCARKYSCSIVGGDTVRSPQGCFISVTVEGEIESGKAVLRSNAKEGDFLCITGSVGDARTGFEVLLNKAERKVYGKSIQRFLEPIPKLQEAGDLIHYFPITSMIDVSDGLASEIFHLCGQSKVGCLIQEDRIPYSKEVAQWAKRMNEPISKYLYESGEEYELLFTVGQNPEITMQNLTNVKFDFTVIGRITPEDSGIRIHKGQKTFPLDSKGWNHFAV